MRGTIRRRRPGVYEINWEVDRDGGKRRRQSDTVYGTKAEAERKLREKVSEAEQMRSAPAGPKPVLLEDFLRTWHREVVMQFPKITTRKRYLDIIEKDLIPVIGGIALQALTARNIHELHQALLGKGLKPLTVQLDRSVLSGAYRHAIHLGMVDRNPVPMVPPPPAHKKEVIPPAMQVVRDLLDLAEREGHPLFAYVHFLAYMGVRRSEGMGLPWSEVDLDNAKVRITVAAVQSGGCGMILETPKTELSRRTLDLPTKTVTVLREHREKQLRQQSGDGDGRPGPGPSNLVFPGSSGRLMAPSTMLRDLKELAGRVGDLTITFHALRHFHASVVLQNHPNPIVASRRLGHSSVITTLKIYGHLMSGWQQGAADAFGQAMEDDKSSTSEGDPTGDDDEQYPPDFPPAGDTTGSD